MPLPANLQPLLQLPYERGTWITLLQDLFPSGSLHLFSSPAEIPVTHPQVESIHQLGSFALPDSEGDPKDIALHEIEVTNQVHLARSRVSLRNFVARLINNAGTDAILAVFHQTDSPDWRLSYVSRRVVLDEETFEIARGEKIPWRDYFLYAYYWEQNYPMTPTHFSLRGDQYKYITYYGVWDTDELFDIRADPMEQNNLIYEPKFAKVRDEMQDRLYEMMDDLGGMTIPMNPPRGRQQSKRLRDRGGVKAADFPEALVVDEPLRKELK